MCVFRHGVKGGESVVLLPLPLFSYVVQSCCIIAELGADMTRAYNAYSAILLYHRGVKGRHDARIQRILRMQHILRITLIQFIQANSARRSQPTAICLV